MAKTKYTTWFRIRPPHSIRPHDLVPPNHAKFQFVAFLVSLLKSYVPRLLWQWTVNKKRHPSNLSHDRKLKTQLQIVHGEEKMKVKYRAWFMLHKLEMYAEISLYEFCSYLVGCIESCDRTTANRWKISYQVYRPSRVCGRTCFGSMFFDYKVMEILLHKLYK